MKTLLRTVPALVVLGLLAALPAAAQLSPMETLGKELYFDQSLSSPSNMSCAFCHGESVGFTGDNPAINKQGAVYPGAVRQRFGNRKPPSSAYAGDSPVFHYDMDEELFVGGMFWDGRATGWVTGDPLADQAMGPYLNPVEQNLPSEQAACMIVAGSKYAPLYEQVFGLPIDCTVSDADGHLAAYKNFARAVAAFERSLEVSPYNSKFDYVMAGEAEFTAQEAQGWELFNGKAMCALCHPAPLFTDFTYDNLGVPKNPANPFYRMDTVYIDGMPINPEGAAWIDSGLAGFLESLPESWFADQGLDKATVVAESYGKHKVPTLRNVDKRPGNGFTKAYMHNGVLKSLAEVVSFYNNRDDMIANGMIVPEVAENMNMDELGALGLSADEEAALVAFMGTLSDGYQPQSKKPKTN
ncbi:cytochrome-c peroxidase [Geoalkalibacter sp.]|uniref:cytochrome-c peroxidase n=1 Tax=Geoalkalibacter sp. TaxID=3041440 RepID=UPI00272E5C38|nr:cytochrome c peroxidase [Geoalkalibacter sp.]